MGGVRRVPLLGFACAVASCLAQAAAAAPRVVLVGVDGASWPVIDGLVAEGKLPNLAALSERGVEARLETVEPVISPVVWTSMATGQPPEVHGIGDLNTKH
jgi:predicted AlkP superfamily phosphohydrolase/phosphomutase